MYLERDSRKARKREGRTQINFAKFRISEKQRNGLQIKQERRNCNLNKFSQTET